MPEGLSRRASSGTDELRMPGVRLYREIHVALAADKEGHALMQLGGHDVEHPMRAVACPSSGLLAEEREGIRLVEKPQFADGHLAVPRIAEHTAAKKIAMKVGDERPDVAYAQRLPFALEPAILAHEELGRLVPVGFVRVVDREISALVRDTDVRMRQQELADGRIEREAMHALPRGVHQHGAGAVDHVAGRHLSPAGLQHVLHFAGTPARDLLHDAENGAHRDVDVDVGGAVERIEQQAVLPAAKPLGYGNDPGLLLGRHRAEPAAVVHGLDDGVVGEHVELLLDFALHVRVLGGAEDVRETRETHLVGNHLRRERHVVQNAGELASGLRMQALLLDDESLDRDDRRRGMLNHGQPLREAGTVGRPQTDGCAGVRARAVPTEATHLVTCRGMLQWTSRALTSMPSPRNLRTTVPTRSVRNVSAPASCSASSTSRFG